MKTTNEQLAEWTINRIKRDFKGEVGLLLGEETYKLDSDVGRTAMSFFFPASAKINQLARTFLIDGIGYDIFPMPWERMERIASLEEDNAPVLLYARILYTGKEEDKNHFQEIQTKLKQNLSDIEYTYRKALEKLAVAMELYQTMVFQDALYQARKAAGHIVLYLANAVAYSNQTYFKHGHMSFMEELSSLKSIPSDFLQLIPAVVGASKKEELTQRCFEMIYNTRQYLELKKTGKTLVTNRSFTDLANWYHELSYWWRELYHYCNEGDAIKVFVRGCNLQSEIDIVREEYGLGELDLMGAFDANDLTSFARQAKALETQFRSIIIEQGAVIDEYRSISDFLAKNNQATGS